MILIMNNILGIILNKLDCKSINKIVRLLVLTKRINVSTNNIWRILFFKNFQQSAGTWFNACKLLTIIGDSYNIRCYQCGPQITNSPYRPTVCPKCNMNLCTKDTCVDRWINISI